MSTKQKGEKAVDHKEHKDHELLVGPNKNSQVNHRDEVGVHNEDKVRLKGSSNKCGSI